MELAENPIKSRHNKTSAMKRIICAIFCLGSICLSHAQSIVLEQVFDGLLTTSANPLTTPFMGEWQHQQSNEAPYIIGVSQGSEEGPGELYDCNGDGLIDENDCYAGNVNYHDTIFFYNKTDFSLYKKVIFRGSIDWMSSVAKGVYTADNNLTCFVAKIGGCDDTDAICGLGIYDENGNKLLDINDVESGDWGSSEMYVIRTELVQIGSTYKLFVLFKEGPTYVYALGGSSSQETAVNNTPIRKFAKPYPNPTNGNIFLPYELTSTTGQMKIYSTNGTLVESRLIAREDSIIELNTRAYPAGLYFYEVEGVSQSFIVKK